MPLSGGVVFYVREGGFGVNCSYRSTFSVVHYVVVLHKHKLPLSIFCKDEGSDVEYTYSVFALCSWVPVVFSRYKPSIS